MGFTGLARIDGYRMERRLADTLSGVEHRDYFEAIAEDFTAIFKRLGHAGVMPHAFLAVGFARTGSDPSLKPLSIKVSNCMDQYGRWSSDKVGQDFEVRYEPLRNRRQQLSAAGWTVSDRDPRNRRAAARRGPSLARRSTAGPGSASGGFARDGRSQ